MVRDVVVLPHRLNVMSAARLLEAEHLREAPVTDARGRCIGVLSAANLLSWAADGRRADEEDHALAACVWSDWQVVEEKPPQRDNVCRYMTRDPLLVTADTRVAAFADVLLESRCRPVVVVDEAERPIGVISSADLLAALASGHRGHDAAPASAILANKRVRHRRSALPEGMAYSLS